MNALSLPADGPRMERSEIRGGTRRHATLLELGLATPRIHHGFVNIRLQKYFVSPLTQISSMTPDVSSHSRGVSRSSRTRGEMRWTRQCPRARSDAGRVYQSVSDHRRADERR